MNKGISSFLNASRWFAAMLVLICHVRHLVLVDFKNVENKDLLAKGFYFWTGLGDEAVVIFFVVSGLLVGALTLEKWRTGTAHGMADYFIHRFSRIYIVLIPAILVGLAADHIGINSFDEAQLYSNSPKYFTVSMSSVIKDHLDAKIVFGNLAMLQNILVHVLGSNGPLWSLAYEWWFYCMWAFAIGAIFYRGLGRWVYAAILVGMMTALPSELLLSMTEWLLGVAVFYYGRSNLPKPHPFVGMVLFLVALFISRISHNIENLLAPEPWYTAFARKFGLGLAYSIALVSLFRLEKPLWLDSLHIKLASFSYSLYLVHFPMMVLIISMVQEHFGIEFLQQPSVESYIYFVLIVSVLYLYAYLFSLVTEKHTFKLVTLLRRIFISEKF